MTEEATLIAIYDFGLFPYALGDILTWNVHTAIRCEELRHKAVDIYVCVDSDDPTILYQRELIDRDNCELFFTEIYSAFSTHPHLGNIYIHRSRQSLVERLQQVATDDVNADIARRYMEALKYRAIAIEALERGAEDNAAVGGTPLPGKTEVHQYFTSELQSHERINEFAARTGKVPYLQPALGCGPDVNQFLLQATSGKRVVPFHLRSRRIDLGYGGQPSYARDSNFLEWYDFLYNALGEFPDVLFIALGRLQEKPISLLRLSNITSLRTLGMGLGHELTLMLQSDFFIGTSSGFAALANFSSIPYAITKMTEDACAAYDIPVGTDKLPFAVSDQKLVYEPETSALLARLLKDGLALSPGRKPAVATVGKHDVENERIQLGLSNPSITTSRFYIDDSQCDEEVIRLLLPNVHDAKNAWLAGDREAARRIVDMIQRNFSEICWTIPQFLLPAGGLAIEKGELQAAVACLFNLEELTAEQNEVSELLQLLRISLVLAIINDFVSPDLDSRFGELKSKLEHANLTAPLSVIPVMPEFRSATGK